MNNSHKIGQGCSTPLENYHEFYYVLLCNHEYIHCLNQRQAKDYITRRNETERKLNLKEGIIDLRYKAVFFSLHASMVQSRTSISCCM